MPQQSRTQPAEAHRPHPRLTDVNLHRLRAEFIRLVAQIGFELDPDDDEDAVYVGSIGFLLSLLDALGGHRGAKHK